MLKIVTLQEIPQIELSRGVKLQNRVTTTKSYHGRAIITLLLHTFNSVYMSLDMRLPGDMYTIPGIQCYMQTSPISQRKEQLS